MTNTPSPQWGERPEGGPSAPPPSPPRRFPPLGWFFWVFIAIQALFVAWIVTGSIEVAKSWPECEGLAGFELELCQAETTGTEIGTALGIGFIVFLWAATDVIVGGAYAIYRLAKKRN
ncbi:hypothetical protein SCMC78_12480 [Streptomyces sp. CMC78]|uniref:Uncharacterized protein n=1 Tax=Streptomyces sp. CMC78 TaxID=3231512 RepID=A0AB33K7M3_9ACTN